MPRGALYSQLVCTLEDLYKGRVRRAPVSAVVMDAFSGMPQTREKAFTISVTKGWKEGTKIRYGAAAVGTRICTVDEVGWEVTICVFASDRMASLL